MVRMDNVAEWAGYFSISCRVAMVFSIPAAASEMQPAAM
jgi:hypothetical protein